MYTGQFSVLSKRGLLEPIDISYCSFPSGHFKCTRINITGVLEMWRKPAEIQTFFSLPGRIAWGVQVN